ncbi:MAG: hypothetical protein H6703_06075 [Myxococcales bacterium]|nr:hypothetical protein [Myxococcales bacterium]
MTSRWGSSWMGRGAGGGALKSSTVPGSASTRRLKVRRSSVRGRAAVAAGAGGRGGSAGSARRGGSGRRFGAAGAAAGAAGANG